MYADLLLLTFSRPLFIASSIFQAGLAYKAKKLFTKEVLSI
jgi:hypothetical protein